MTAPCQKCKLARPITLPLIATYTLSSSTHKNRLTSPLLRLPAEIRNAIYNYIGTYTTIKVDVWTQQATASHGKTLRLKFQLPALLATCKQVRHEATTLLCKLSTVDTDAIAAFGWLHSDCGHAFCALVTCVRVPRDFAVSIARGARARAFRSEDFAYSTVSLPSLDKIIVKGRTMSMRDGIRAAQRRWARNKALEVVFEE